NLTTTRLGTAWLVSKLSTEVGGIASLHDQAVTYPAASASVAVRLTSTELAPAAAAAGIATAMTVPGLSRPRAAPIPERVSSTRVGEMAVATSRGGSAVAGSPPAIKVAKTATTRTRTARIDRPPVSGPAVACAYHGHETEMYVIEL